MCELLRPAVRLSTWLGLLIVGAFVGLSCSGPETSNSVETASRLYHVQLDQTKKKKRADRLIGQAIDWWNEHAASVGPRPATTEEPPVHVTWRAPLYRIRLGPFASRADADSVLAVAQQRFPEAFVRPERRSSDP